MLFFAFITAFIKFISSDYYIITAIGFGFGLVSVIGVWQFLDESPLYLLRKGRISEAESIIRRIYVVNDF